VSAQGQKLIAINNIPDHFHLLIGLKPTMALSDIIGKIKSVWRDQRYIFKDYSGPGE